jgi:hypothetical protein
MLMDAGPRSAITIVLSSCEKNRQDRAIGRFGGAPLSCDRRAIIFCKRVGARLVQLHEASAPSNIFTIARIIFSLPSSSLSHPAEEAPAPLTARQLARCMAIHTISHP